MKIIYGKKGSSNKEVIYITNEDIPIPTGKTFHELPISILKKIEQTTLEQKKVYQLFNYSNICIWWYIYPTIFATFARTIFFIINFEKIIKNYNPDSIHLVAEFDKAEIIAQICAKHGIRFSCSEYYKLIFKIKNKIFNFIQPRRHKIITNKKRKNRLNTYKTINKTISTINESVVFFVPTSYRRDIYDPKQKETIRGEYLIEPIFSLLEKLSIKLVNIDVDYSFEGNPNILKERLEDKLTWFPVEKILEQTKNHNKSIFLKQYLSIINNRQFQNLFVFNDIKIWNSLKSDFKMLSYESYIPIFIEMYEAFLKFFKTQKPKTIFIPYETGPYALALINASKENGIKTIGIQHGGLIVQHPDYIHDIIQDSNNKFGMPIPDVLLVFGEYYKNALIEQANYPSDKIEVFGNPLYFDLNRVLQSLDVQTLRKKYQVTNKVILFTSAMFQKYYSQGGLRDYDERIFEELAKKFVNNYEYTVILKPHPSEINIETYLNIIKKYGCKNFHVKQGNLFELIQISDVVLSFFSTSLIDSVMLNKPTIRVVFPGTEVASIFTDNSIFLESGLDNLFKNILELLNNNEIHESLMKKRNQFMLYNYNIPNPNSLNQLKCILDVR